MSQLAIAKSELSNTKRLIKSQKAQLASVLKREKEAMYEWRVLANQAMTYENAIEELYGVQYQWEQKVKRLEGMSKEPEYARSF